MPYAEVNGVNLYYESSGDGFPLVWSHEFAGDYRSWEPQVRFFSRRYRVITYCARGYPPSDVPGGLDAYSQEQAVEDLRGLLGYLGIKRAHVGGLSMGGNVALNFGLAHPRLARSLVVAGTGTGSDSPDIVRRATWPGSPDAWSLAAWRRWRTTRGGRRACSYCARTPRAGASSPTSSPNTRPPAPLSRFAVCRAGGRPSTRWKTGCALWTCPR